MQEARSTLDVLGTAYLGLFGAWAPIQATSLGIPGHDHRVPDVTESAQADVARGMATLRDKAVSIDPDRLTGTDRGTRAALVHASQAVIDSIESREVEWAIGGVGLGPIYTVLALVGKVNLGSELGASNYLQRCEGLPTYLDQSAERLRAGAQKGLVANDRAIRSAMDQISRYLETTTASDPLLQALPHVPDDQLRRLIQASVTDGVRPAMERILETIRNHILPAARPDERCGALHMPRGADIYARAISVHTTTDLTARELHHTGLQMGERLRAELCELGRSAMNTSDFEQLQHRLREDESLRYAAPEEILEDARGALARAGEAAPRWFGRLNSAACEILAMPEDEARYSPVGQYRPPAVDGSHSGQYWVNTSEPRTHSRHEIEAVTFHEGVPGHHLQFAIAQDLSDLPEFRRHLYVTACGEGWGLYAERLADEMGLYSDDLARMGMVALDMWRAARLVVDTGVHAFGWTRDQSIEYMQVNTAMPPSLIAAEVDRYICWPGQALAYMVGRLEILRLRDFAQSRLGARFDIAQFHDVVLGGGSVPLSQLADGVQRWVTEIESTGDASASHHVPTGR